MGTQSHRDPEPQGSRARGTLSHRALEPQEPRAMGTQSYGDTEPRGHRATGIRSQGDPELQRPGATGTQRHGDPELWGHRATETQSYRFTEPQGPRARGIRSHRNPEPREPRAMETQSNRDPEQWGPRATGTQSHGDTEEPQGPRAIGTQSHGTPHALGEAAHRERVWLFSEKLTHTLPSSHHPHLDPEMKPSRRNEDKFHIQTFIGHPGQPHSLLLEAANNSDASPQWSQYRNQHSHTREHCSAGLQLNSVQQQQQQQQQQQGGPSDVLYSGQAAACPDTLYTRAHAGRQWLWGLCCPMPSSIIRGLVMPRFQTNFQLLRTSNNHS